MVKVKIRDDLKTAGDCPDFAESSERNGTVPLSGVLRGTRTPPSLGVPDVERKLGMRVAF